MSDTPAPKSDIHVPANAGEHAGGLRRVLERFDYGWGGTIDTGPGWYPIVVELADVLAVIAPHYTIQQIKSKYGGLRFYYELNLPHNPPHLEASAPDFPGFAPKDAAPEHLAAFEVAEAKYDAAVNAWGETAEAWFATAEGKVWTQRHDELRERAEGLVREAEAKAAVTCEQCGSTGATTSRSGGPGSWVSTLCASCRS